MKCVFTLCSREPSYGREFSSKLAAMYTRIRGVAMGVYRVYIQYTLPKSVQVNFYGVDMTSEQLLNMNIKVLYLPKTNFWLRPWPGLSCSKRCNERIVGECVVFRVSVCEMKGRLQETHNGRYDELSSSTLSAIQQLYHSLDKRRFHCSSEGTFYLSLIVNRITSIIWAVELG